MSSGYLKRWRKCKAEVEALARPGSSEDDIPQDASDVSPDEAERLDAPDEAERLDAPDISPDEANVPDSSPGEAYAVDDEPDFSSDPSNESLTSESEVEGNLELGEEISMWATKNKCSRSSVNEILDLLRRHGHRLPKDARTLLKTPRIIHTINKCGGEFIYLGIESGLLKVIAQHPKCFRDNVADLNFNIDGVPLFKSSNSQLWPILCSVKNFEPFIVALYYGNSKPNSVEDYLSEFLTELTGLKETGVTLNDKVVQVSVNAFVCDAPARAFLKCTKAHNAYYSCERCIIKGEWNGRVVFDIFDDEDMPSLRTEESFNDFQYQLTHQLKRSPLIEAGLSCIKSFPLDYMHLICLGVMKRILSFLKNGPRECKLSYQQFSRISDRLVELNGKMPREFARQPRSLHEMDRWKATEFRQFLLYTGPLVLRHIVPQILYDHFISLTVAVSILLQSNDTTRNYYLDYAKELLVYFVKKGKTIYGDTFTSYNVHALIHIADDVRNLGTSLNQISAFPFENRLHRLKKSVKKSQNPIAQIAKRAAELETSKYKYIGKDNSIFVSTKRKDCCFITKDLHFAFVKEKRRNRTYVCDVVSQRHMESFFDAQCNSKLLDILVVKNIRQHARRKLLEHNDLDKKVVCLPYDTGFLLLPMLHGLERQ